MVLTVNLRSGQKSHKHIMTKLKEVMRKQSYHFAENSNELQKMLEKLTESHNDLCKLLELHMKGTSGDDSAASRCCLLRTIYLLCSVVL